MTALVWLLEILFWEGITQLTFRAGRLGSAHPRPTLVDFNWWFDCLIRSRKRLKVPVKLESGLCSRTGVRNASILALQVGFELTTCQQTDLGKWFNETISIQNMAGCVASAISGLTFEGLPSA